MIPDQKNLTEYRDFLFYKIFRYSTAARNIAKTKNIDYININLDTEDGYITILYIEIYYQSKISFGFLSVQKIKKN